MKRYQFVKVVLALFFIMGVSSSYCNAQDYSNIPHQLMGNRFLTLNTIIRVNQIEVTRDKNVGRDEYHLHTPEKVKTFRDAVSSEFPEARITWAFSWLALHDQRDNYIDCVNLDGWTMDFLAARRPGFEDGFNSRMGDINQKGTRPQDTPKLVPDLSPDAKSLIEKHYPYLFNTDRTRGVYRYF
jgi:hypothetical protein